MKNNVGILKIDLTKRKKNLSLYQKVQRLTIIDKSDFHQELACGNVK